MESHAQIIQLLNQQKKALSEKQIEQLSQVIKEHQIISGKISKKELALKQINIPFSIAVFHQKIFMIAPGKKLNALIGSTNSSKVKLALCLTEDKIRAIKIILIYGDKEMKDRRKQRCFNEAKINLARKSSLGFFPYQSFSMKSERFFIDLEYFPDGDLYHCIQSLNQQGIFNNFFDRLILAEKIVTVIKEFHDEGFIHRDLKPANIMMLKDGVKLIDFASTTVGDFVDEDIYGTKGFIAPEIFRDKLYTEKTEVYALGGILGQLFNFIKNFNYSTQRFEFYTDWITEHHIYLLKLQDYVKKIYDPIPEQRPTFSEIKDFLGKQIQQCPKKLRQKSADVTPKLTISFFQREENFPTLSIEDPAQIEEISPSKRKII